MEHVNRSTPAVVGRGRDERKVAADRRDSTERIAWRTVAGRETLRLSPRAGLILLEDIRGTSRAIHDGRAYDQGVVLDRERPPEPVTDLSIDLEFR